MYRTMLSETFQILYFIKSFRIIFSITCSIVFSVKKFAQINYWKPGARRIKDVESFETDTEL